MGDFGIVPMFDSAGFRDGLGLAAAIDRAALTSLRA